jgi:CheY-like chemotaxis protein
VGVESLGEELQTVDQWAQCRELGAVAHLTKPVRFDDLKEVIDGLPAPGVD